MKARAVPNTTKVKVPSRRATFAPDLGKVAPDL
jgi:hypothetical protein